MQQLGCTTLEQSKKLVETGLDPNTADMFYSRRPTGKSDYSIFPDFKPEGRLEVFTKVDLPCWSLGALLTLMPKTMKGIPAKAAYHLTLKENVYNAWECNYEHFSFGELYEFPAQPTPIEAAVYTILWLLERGYIGKV